MSGSTLLRFRNSVVCVTAKLWCMRFFNTPSLPPHEIDDAVLTLTERDAAKLEWPLSRRESTWFLAFGCLVLTLFLGRLVQLNFIQGSEYQELARQNSLRSLTVVAPRGIIYDRHGEPLVENVPSLDAVIVPSELPESKAERDEALANIKQLFQPDQEVWEALFVRLAAGTNDPLILKTNLDQATIIRFFTERSRLLGVVLQKTAERRYVDGNIFAHVIGYEGKIRPEEYTTLKSSGYLLTDSIGKQGVERSYESLLRGVHGKELIEVDALGNIQQALGIIAPQKGQDLFLSLDAGLQREAFAIMERVLGESELKKGALVALDPRSGAVRALVSFPSYDNNLFAGGISRDDYALLASDPHKPLFNRAIAGEYPPGSTIKPLLAGAALAEGIITPETTIESRGGIQVGRSFFGDWKAHGFTDLRRAIAVSSDVYFYSIGGGYGGIRGLGMERMKSYEERFGWGAKTGIDLPGEQDGFLPTPTWKAERFKERWYVGDDYNASIGQGYVTTTPLQVLSAIAAIGNGGTLYQPRVVEAVQSMTNQRDIKSPIVLRDTILPKNILEVVREGMRETVTEGTAQSLKDLPVAVAGKTGTSQFGGGKQTHGWFASFAPYDNPELAVVVLVEDQPERSTYHAVPITKALYEWYFEREKNAQDKPKN